MSGKFTKRYISKLENLFLEISKIVVETVVDCPLGVTECKHCDDLGKALDLLNRVKNGVLRMEAMEAMDQ